MASVEAQAKKAMLLHRFLIKVNLYLPLAQSCELILLRFAFPVQQPEVQLLFALEDQQSYH